jgi:DNA-binding CsgD family transcriptional regulator
MNAIISGRSGRALLIEGASLKSFEVEDPSTLTSRQQADLPYIFGEGADLRILEDTTIENVVLELNSDCNFTWALDLTLISLDIELPKEIRKEAVDSLEKMLEMKEILAQVEYVLYAHPLPADTDLKGTLELATLPASSTVHKFLLDLEKFQPKISEVCRAWESIPTPLFGSYEDREAFRSLAVREGLFQVLTKEPPSSSLFFNRVLASSSIRRLRNHVRVLTKWHKLSDMTFRDDLKVAKAVKLESIRSRRHDARGGLIKREMAVAALRKTRGNQVRAAKLLGISPKDLRKLLSNSKTKTKTKNKDERRELTV